MGQAVRGSESDVEAQEPWAGWLQRPQSHVLRLGRLAVVAATCWGIYTDPARPCHLSE